MRLKADCFAKLFCGLFIVTSLFSCLFFAHLTTCSSSNEKEGPSFSHNHTSNHSHNLSFDNKIDPCSKLDPIIPLRPPLLEITTTDLSQQRLHFASDVNLTYHDQTISLNETAHFVEIKCSASYPIDLIYEGHLSNRKAKATHIKRRGNACFQVQVEVIAYLYNTGNYSCFSVEKKHTRSSFYIYFTPLVNTILINREQRIIIKPKAEDRIVRLPCPTSNPKFQMKLEKKVTNVEANNATWEDYGNSKNIDGPYDPKFGWSLKIAEFENISEPQQYRCSSIYNEMDQNEIHVFPVPVSFKNFEDDEDEKTSKQQESSSSSSGNPNNQDQIATTRRRNTTYRDLLTYCKQNSGDLVSSDCSTWIECRMRQCTIYEEGCESKSSCAQNISNCPTGIIQCLRDGVEPVTMIYFQGLKSSKYYTNQKEAPLNDILSISVKSVQRIKEIEVKEGQTQTGNQEQEQGHVHLDKDRKVTFVCTGSSFVFCMYFQWTVKMTDGHSMVIPKENVTNNRWNKFSSFISSEVEIEIPNEFQEIICSAPVWNETTVQTVSATKIEVFSQIMKLESTGTKPTKNGKQNHRAFLPHYVISWVLLLHCIFM